MQLWISELGFNRLTGLPHYRSNRYQLMKIAAGIEYDGSAYCGWQSQLGVRTIQDAVQHALSKIADHKVSVVCAGRTDTGVHAIEQVVHFETRAKRSMRSWVLGTNTHLPSDICLLWARAVPEQFHARFAAKSRQYRYIILNRPVPPGILNHKVTWQHQPLDEIRMQVAALKLMGRHDFSSFRALSCQSKQPVRTIYDIRVMREKSCVYIDVLANGFLHHMVRNIAGVLIAVGKGERPVSWVQELLALRDRTKGGVTAAADGLYLVKVKYEPTFGLSEEIDPPRLC